MFLILNIFLKNNLLCSPYTKTLLIDSVEQSKNRES